MAKILIVEDNEKNRRLLNLVLASKGHILFEAANGKEAVEKVREHNPDMVIMDIQLPEIDGLEATRILKQDKNTSGVKVLVLTAYAMKGDRERILEAGSDAYLSKPANIEDMLSMIDSLLIG
ncbi:MAG: response regulator [Firmicutes bacterium]|nr:response regulator [Bacillota bacterium]